MSDEQVRTLDLLLKKGNFTQVANELLEYLASRSDLTGAELRICIFLIRELCGWDYPFKPITISEFLLGTNLKVSFLKDSLKSLVAKKILLKRKVKGYRAPCYGFNPDLLGRVVIGEPRQYFQVDNCTVIDLKEFRLSKSKVRQNVLSKYAPADFESTLERTQKISKSAIRAVLKAPKYPYIPLNTLSKEKKEVDKNDWNEVKECLLTQFPNDEARLEGTFKQIKDRGYERENQTPIRPKNIPAWLFVAYKDIRHEYEHHDRRRAQ